jgi:hypothetical protein
VAELTTTPRRSASEAQDAAPALTDRFRAAVGLAQEIHEHQRRPGTETPYLAHLLVVTGLVLGDGGGGGEDQAIAAMLHDSVEDGGGRPMLERPARRSARGSRPSSRGAPMRSTGTRPDGGSRASAATCVISRRWTTTRPCTPRSPTRSITRARFVRGLPSRRACAVRLSPSPVGQERIRWCHEGAIGRHCHVDRTGPMNPQ